MFNMTIIRNERRIDFTFNLTFSNGATQTMVIKEWTYDAAERQIATLYNGAKLNWII